MCVWLCCCDVDLHVCVGVFGSLSMHAVVLVYVYVRVLSLSLG